MSVYGQLKACSDSKTLNYDTLFCVTIVKVLLIKISIYIYNLKQTSWDPEDKQQTFSWGSAAFL